MMLTSVVLAGRYRLLETIGQGGVAAVYRAHDLLLDREVAVKILRAGAIADPRRVERLRFEAHHAAILHHPNIVTVGEAGFDPSSRTEFIAMQLVEGPDLRRVLDRSRVLPVGFAVRIGLEAARALAYAHEHGVLHGDIRPENILIDADGDVRVADFGISRVLADEGGPTSEATLGSAPYVSPEQVLGAPVGPRSDLYSLGVVLYECLTGVRPFVGPSAADEALARVRVAPLRITTIDPTLPPRLGRLVMRLLSRSPGQRPRSAVEVVRELERFRTRTIDARRPGGHVRERMARLRQRPRAMDAAGAAILMNPVWTDPDTPEPTDAQPAPPSTPPVVPAAPSALPRASTPAPPRRRRRGIPTIDGQLSRRAAALAILLIATFGLMAVNGGDLSGGVLGTTASSSDDPGDVAIVAPRVSPDASADRSLPALPPLPPPVTAPSDTPIPTAPPAATLRPSATPRPTPTAAPTPRPTVRPTPRPTPRPTTAPAPAAVRGPAATVARFYALVVRHDYDAAARLWSRALRERYPPDRYIAGRFDATTAVDVHRLETTRQGSRTAVVATDITEHRASGASRHWVGTWDLVKIDGVWLMDDPDLSGP
jgi:serine/threonine-protein kinase